MDRLVSRLEGIEKHILSDPVLRTLASSSSTAPFVSLRIQQIIKNIVASKRQQEIQMLYEKLAACEQNSVGDIVTLKQMLANSKQEIYKLERALSAKNQISKDELYRQERMIVAKQDQLDIITKSHREQAEQIYRLQADLELLQKQYLQCKDICSTMAMKNETLEKQCNHYKQVSENLDSDKRSQNYTIDDYSQKLKKQQSKSQQFRHNLMETQTELKQLKLQKESVDRHVREATRKISELQDALEQMTSKLRKTQQENRQQNQKSQLLKNREQSLLAQVDQMRDSLKNKQKHNRQITEKYNEQTIKNQSLANKIESGQRQKTLLQAQLSIQKDKQMSYLAKIDKMVELQQQCLNLKEDLLNTRSKERALKEDIDRLAKDYGTQKNKLTEEIDRLHKINKGQEAAISQLQLLIQEKDMHIADRHYRMNDLADVARRSELKLIENIEGVKHDKNKQITKKNKKIEQLKEFIKILEGKLTALTKDLAESQQIQNKQSKELMIKQANISRLQENNKNMKLQTTMKLHKIKLIFDEVKSQLRHMKKQYTICIKQADNILRKHCQNILAAIRYTTKSKQHEIEELSRLFKEQTAELQRLVSQKNSQHRKEIQIYKQQMALRDGLLKKVQGQLNSQRKNNIILRETIHSEAKRGVIKKLEYEQELSEAKQKHVKQELVTSQKLLDLQKRYQEVLLDSRDRYRQFQRKMDDMTARKSSFRHV